MKHLVCKDRLPNTPEAATMAHQYAFFHPMEVDAFNFPLYQHFADGKMFVSCAIGTLDLDSLLAFHSDRLFRGAQLDRASGRNGWRIDHRQLLFQLETDTWLYMNTNVGCCRVFARDRVLAQKTAREIVERFRVRRRQGKANFHLISMDGGCVSTTRVEVARGVKRTQAELSLLYGDDFSIWAKSLADSLSGPRPGTVILRGPPGVGKTSFIRHLIGRLWRTHRFHFLPTSELELLSSPRLVDFWAQETSRYGTLVKIVVLEDAEAVLVDRRDGDRGAIANLLNIADGLLGDFLKVKLLCTVNCQLDRLDPAVVRAGRLLAYREFTRIPAERAALIAAEYDRCLEPQADYSLAEIFAGPAKTRPATEREILGFASRSA